MNQSVMQQTRATETERTTVTPLEGELLYTTDEKKLYVGDGSTAGGILVTGAPFITENMTLNVPADYADINDALEYLNAFRIASNAIVTIQVADGTYTYTEAITINHHDARSIQIIGNETTPANCTIWNPVSGSIFYIRQNSLGFISGFKLNGEEDSVNYPAGVGVNRIGIHVNNNSDVQAGFIETVNCYRGIYIAHSSAFAIKSIKSTFNTHAGMMVNINSECYVYDDCDLSNNANGLHVTANSMASVANSNMKVQNNTDTGIICYNSSMINAASAIITGNTNYDLKAQNSSFIQINSTTSYSTCIPAVNTVGNYNSLIRD